MAEPSEQIEFRYDEWAAELARIEAMARAGRGWVNLRPEVEDDDAAAPRSKVAGLFSAAGPTVPLATWVAPTGRDPASAGVQHGVAAKVVSRLQEHGVGLPPGAVVVQDHSRRGLVVRLADDTGADVILAWMMEAVDDLCPVALTGHWRADIHLG
ncbi:MAG: hypothetical protein WKF43_12650 [Acidimicrobiales bacterium]